MKIVFLWPILSIVWCIIGKLKLSYWKWNFYISHCWIISPALSHHRNKELLRNCLSLLHITITYNRNGLFLEHFVEILQKISFQFVCLSFNLSPWALKLIHRNQYPAFPFSDVSKSQVRNWPILQFSDSPILSRVLQNWTHFSNTVPCRPSPV